LKKKLILPNITLLAAASVNVDETQLALKISSQNIEFGAIKLLSSSVPNTRPTDIEFVTIPPMNFLEYNRMMIKDLHKYFETSYCLIVQADGFIVNADLWKEEFLEFDYVGAPWPDKVQVNPGNWFLHLEKNRVGNGGFSLRSRKLVETTAKINFNSLKFPIKSEDIIICHYLYKEMIDNGIRFAPPKLAAQFSIESLDNLYGQDINSVFGFHGKHLMSHFLKKHD